MEDLSIRQIVFPTDYSDISANAGRTAAQLAWHFGARLHVVHVVPPVTDPGPPEALPAAVAKLGAGIDTVTAIMTGRPAPAIVEYATRHDTDMIVIGAHGRTGVSRALLGSVAEAVIRRAPCLVLTVPAGVSVNQSDDGSPRDEPCVVCGEPSPDLICTTCRGLIRDEAQAASRPLSGQAGEQATRR
jgi:universal stress protein A